MQFLLLGLVALLLFLIAARAYTMANPQVLVRQLRIGAGVAAACRRGFSRLSRAGRLRHVDGGARLVAAVGHWRVSLGRLPEQPDKSPGQSSRVVTDHLEVELDHDTGAIRGQVRKGSFAGRELEDLSPQEMARLWQDCRFADPQSAQILEAYLDRVHPTLAGGPVPHRRRRWRVSHRRRG